MKKSVMTLLAVVASLVLSAGAFAQESNRDADGNIVKGPYVQNGFWDNWFVTGSGGLNVAWNEAKADRGYDVYDSNYGFGAAIDATIGKWFNPNLGFRLGYQMLRASVDRYEYNQSKYQFPHADLLLNISNMLAGYKELRTVNVVPYAHVGYLMGEQNGFAGGAGIMTPIRLGNRVDLVPEIRMNFFKDDVFDEVRNYGALNGSALLGLAIKLGKTNWSRPAAPVVIPVPVPEPEPAPAPEPEPEPEPEP